ncbi:SDR family NAD(P)-dependent oxidoreductase [Carboxylicivirga mesophila]|uniref:SDR family NAD(P)-dependent oxidoreductase n=1 Tax=Carboxylicivirga mesophila TaxID=1166478 RepID=A0ABS5K913_9BACT|nr:SDR family NAD(P)-dependent oxidoreductase [Carboxylicivirga mesophila]MBS2211451.1 SDR family NAD(P)-dependent oxidoreductase [Carboxylicivirga mesophila]
MTAPNKKIAIITGPTSGIGQAFAIKLAEQGYELLLIARRKEKLVELSSFLSANYNTTINYIVADLSKESDIQQVEQHIHSLQNIHLLINNAGFGIAGYFMEVSMEEQLRMINVHLTSTVRFSKAVLPEMIKQQSGYIINLASFAAFMELPGSVMYATTKAAIIKFSQTLQSEVGRYGIKIQALSPGFTPTSFHSAIDRKAEFVNRVPDFLWTPVEQVVEASLANLNSNKVICIPGTINTLLFWLNKSPLLSRWIQHVATKRQKPPKSSVLTTKI